MLFKFSFFIGYSSGSSCAWKLGKILMRLAHILLTQMNSQIRHPHLLIAISNCTISSKKQKNRKKRKNSVSAIKFEVYIPTFLQIVWNIFFLPKSSVFAGCLKNPLVPSLLFRSASDFLKGKWYLKKNNTAFTLNFWYD